MSMVCLDTQVLSWAMQHIAGQSIDKKHRTASAEIQELRERAAALVQKLNDEKTLIGLPCAVVGEFLCIVPEEQHHAVLAVLAKAFMLLPYDAGSALLYATMFRERKDELEASGANNTSGQPTRAEMKTDFLIVATAVTAKASTIYSHDPHLKQFARGRIQVLEMPPRPATQLSLIDAKQPASGATTTST